MRKAPGPVIRFRGFFLLAFAYYYERTKGVRMAGLEPARR